MDDGVLINSEKNIAFLQTIKTQLLEKFITKKTFSEFRKEMIKQYEYKKARQTLLNTNPKEAWKKYPKQEYEDVCACYSNKNILIPRNCIEHTYKEHIDMDDNVWQEFLDSCNPTTDEKVKAKYDGRYGQRWIYKCQGKAHYFGYVLDIFEKSEPQVVTVFTDHENSVNNWVQNAVNKKSKEYES